MLPRDLFDHKTHHANSVGVNWGLRPFRFENCQLLYNEFLVLARQWWDYPDVQVFTGFKIAKELQLPKNNIKVWNRNFFCRMEVIKDSVSKKEWDLVEERVERG